MVQETVKMMVAVLMPEFHLGNANRNYTLAFGSLSFKCLDRSFQSGETPSTTWCRESARASLGRGMVTESLLQKVVNDVDVVAKRPLQNQGTR